MNIPLTDVTEAKHSKSKSTTKKALFQSRQKIYVRKISGFYQRIRRVSLTVLLFMYFSFAWISMDGQPLILFDLNENKFHLFGMIFWPQDFTLLAFSLIICAFGLFFVTALFGRVWCGYSCPQTAWTLIFIWLEELFEGSRNQRIKLDQSPNSLSKWLKKSGKHLSWMTVSLATGLTFVGYFYPIRALIVELSDFSLINGMTLFWVMFFTLATYINAGWLREQVCIYMCPYARFQSAMFNEDTKVITYDTQRGEPRGKRSSKPSDYTLGDCVNCEMCVHVCPVGIDIRDGLQYECIGCALCIDACDSVMNKLSYPTGLIRYTSEKALAQNSAIKGYNWRALGYGSVLLVTISVFITLMINRPMVELTALRDRGVLYEENYQGNIENFYTLKLVNKREIPDTFELRVSGLTSFNAQPKTISVEPGEVKTIPFTLEVAPEQIIEANNDIIFRAISLTDANIQATIPSKYLGPVWH